MNNVIKIFLELSKWFIASEDFTNAILHRSPVDSFKFEISQRTKASFFMQLKGSNAYLGLNITHNNIVYKALDSPLTAIYKDDFSFIIENGREKYLFKFTTRYIELKNFLYHHFPSLSKLKDCGRSLNPLNTVWSIPNNFAKGMQLKAVSVSAAEIFKEDMSWKLWSQTLRAGRLLSVIKKVKCFMERGEIKFKIFIDFVCVDIISGNLPKDWYLDGLHFTSKDAFGVVSAVNPFNFFSRTYDIFALLETEYDEVEVYVLQSKGWDIDFLKPQICVKAVISPRYDRYYCETQMRYILGDLADESCLLAIVYPERNLIKQLDLKLKLEETSVKFEAFTFEHNLWRVNGRRNFFSNNTNLHTSLRTHIFHMGFPTGKRENRHVFIDGIEYKRESSILDRTTKYMRAVFVRRNSWDFLEENLVLVYHGRNCDISRFNEYFVPFPEQDFYRLPKVEKFEGGLQARNVLDMDYHGFFMYVVNEVLVTPTKFLKLTTACSPMSFKKALMSNGLRNIKVETLDVCFRHDGQLKTIRINNWAHRLTEKRIEICAEYTNETEAETKLEVYFAVISKTLPFSDVEYPNASGDHFLIVWGSTFEKRSPSINCSDHELAVLKRNDYKVTSRKTRQFNSHFEVLEKSIRIMHTRDDDVIHHTVGVAA